jgi:glycosyltransferase involved in cell wall biosynthesis
MIKLSIVLATRNEEENIARCLQSVKELADEVVIVDEDSTDKTRDIAGEFSAKIFLEPHHDIFHITKQKALDKATGEWILQLDADEAVTPALAQEIKEVINMPNDEIKKRFDINSLEMHLFKKHQQLIEARDGKIGNDSGEVVAFFIPRLNMFLGRPLKYGGVYPDGVIRLIKNGKARFPQKSVHEQMQIDGEVSWLFNNLEHYDSPTLKKYLVRFNRYTNLHAKELADKKVSKGIFSFAYYTIYKPIYTFLNIYVRHKGILDGPQGFLWAFFSAMHFPVAYFKYITNKV